MARNEEKAQSTLNRFVGQPPCFLLLSIPVVYEFLDTVINPSQVSGCQGGGGAGA